jgi:hypothetical protein
MKHLNHITLGFVITLVLATAAQGADGFTSTGSLGTARYSHTATLLPNGKVLVAGGESYFIDDNNDVVPTFSTSAELYDPAAGTWTPTGSLGTARTGHTATLVSNGKVLVAGGFIRVGGYFIPLASAELYDPATGNWSATGSLGGERASHTATLLPSGKVLVAGGEDFNGTTVSDAQLYDPAKGTWSHTGSLAHVRAGHTATLLLNGKVLVAGGGYGGAELYDPATGKWSATGSLANPRNVHTATLLSNGKVLVAGGEINTNGSPIFLTNAELYDPAVGTWSATGSLGTARYFHTASLLANGKVIVAGGESGFSGVLASAELYDPAAGTWSPTGSLGFERYDHTATLLANGKVLFAGGLGFSGFIHTSAELFESFLNPILNPIKLGDGSFQFGFSNPSGPGYRVLASTDVAAPLNIWSNLGPATETPPGSGQFQFTDHQATNYPQRFYRVSSP